MIPIILTLSIFFLYSCYYDTDKKLHKPTANYRVIDKTLIVDYYDSGGDIFKIREELFRNNSLIVAVNLTYDKMQDNHIFNNITFNNFPDKSYILKSIVYDQQGNIVVSAYQY